MSFTSVSHSAAGYGHTPYKPTYPNGIHNTPYPLETEDTRAVDFSPYNDAYRNSQTNTGHAHQPNSNEFRPPTDGVNDSAQHPPQCLYQHPVPSHSLYPLHQPWQTSLLSGSPEKSLRDEKSVTNYGREDFANPYAQEKSVKPACLESMVSHPDVYSNTGNHSTNTSGSLYFSDTASPLSSNSSSGYGSSSGSTSSSPYPSPSLPDPAPSRQLDAEPTTAETAPPIEDGPTVKPKKARTSYSTEQIRTLETAFKENAYPDYDKLEELAKTLGVTERKIKVWFQNKRARWRKKHAAEPVYNPDMYSAPTPVTSHLPVPARTGLSANTASGYSAPPKLYQRHAKQTAPSNYPVSSQYQTPGPMSGLYPPYTPTMYPNQGSVPPFCRTNPSSDDVTPGYPGAKATASSTIGYLPSSIPPSSGQASPYQYPYTLPLR